MSHTRGPWTYNDYSGRVRGPEGNTIADCRYKNGKIDGPLIAAAPELLEALKEVVSDINDPDDFTSKKYSYVIAKATGGAQ